MSDLAVNIRRYRLEHGMTQAQVGEALGGSDRSLICHYESGQITPSIGKLKQLADLFEVTLDDLYGC